MPRWKPTSDRALHYVVVAGVDDSSQVVLLNDPAQRKLLKEDRAQFEHEWKATGFWTLLAVPAVAARRYALNYALRQRFGCNGPSARLCGACLAGARPAHNLYPLKLAMEALAAACRAVERTRERWLGNRNAAFSRRRLLLRTGLMAGLQARWKGDALKIALVEGERLAPMDARFPTELAGVAFKQKQNARAERLLRRSLRLAPGDNYANDFLATLYFLDGNIEAALGGSIGIVLPNRRSARFAPNLGLAFHPRCSITHLLSHHKAG